MSDNVVAPRTHQELTEFARGIMGRLLEKYNAEGRHFSDEMAGAGLIYRCAGSVSLLLLANGFDELAGEGEWQEVVKAEFKKVYDHVANKGYDVTPLIPGNLTEELFSPKAPVRYHYLDSVSWVLSLSLQMRLASSTGKLTLDDQLDAIKKLAKDSLTIICDAACPGGGWGFSSGVSKPDLYYSYGVSEALADFGDYVLGESEEEIGIPADFELQEFLGPELLARVDEQRQLTSKWLIERYLQTLGSKEVNPHPDEPDQPYILLYYTYFVLDMLIVNKADEYFAVKKDQINQSVEHAIYRSRIDFDRAYATGDDWWGNPKLSSLRLSWDNHENQELINRIKNRPRFPELFEPGLVPLSLRCNLLYAFYIADGEDQKMNKLFQVLYENRHPDSGLWDKSSYDLMVTERAIEAIVDFNDYLVKFEGRAAPRYIAPPEPHPHPLDSSFQALIKTVVKDYLESEDGGRCLQGRTAVAPHPEAAPQNGERMDEEKVLDLLTSALADGEAVLAGSGTTPLKRDTLEGFIQEFGKFQRLRLYEELKKTVGDDPEKQKALLDGMERNRKGLLNRLGPWFSKDSSDLAMVFDWLLDKISKDPTRGRQ